MQLQNTVFSMQWICTVKISSKILFSLPLLTNFVYYANQQTRLDKVSCY